MPLRPAESHHSATEAMPAWDSMAEGAERDTAGFRATKTSETHEGTIMSIQPIQISDEERERINAAAAELNRRVEAFAHAIRPAFEAIGREMTRVLGPALAFLRQLEQLRNESRTVRRQDYRRRQVARRRRQR